MAENNTSVEYNLDENSNCEGYKNEDIGNNESILLDCDHESSDIEVSLVGWSEVSSDHTDCGDEWGDNGHNTITIEPFNEDSGPTLPETFRILWQ